MWTWTCMYVFTLLFLFKSNKFDSLKLELYVCMPLSNHWFYCKMNTKWQPIYLSSDQVTWFKLTTKQLQFTPLFFFKLLTLFLWHFSSCTCFSLFTFWTMVHSLPRIYTYQSVFSNRSWSLSSEFESCVWEDDESLS